MTIPMDYSNDTVEKCVDFIERTDLDLNMYKVCWAAYTQNRQTFNIISTYVIPRTMKTCEVCHSSRDAVSEMESIEIFYIISQIVLAPLAQSAVKW